MEPTNAAKPPTPWAGGVNIGPYLLLREIARGGMGEIWLAQHRGPAGFERLVVLKRIITAPDDDPDMLSMFLDEARIVSVLQHPNVVQVSELGQDGPSYYLVMEYLAGQTLGRIARRLFEQKGSLPLALSLQIVADAARGLGSAHRQKSTDGRPLHIVHRDVSPQNILVTYEGQTKVLDFGIATIAGRGTRTQTGVLKGKLGYMSPEQALGLPLGPQVDVFSLGVILFELLTNSRLHTGSDDVAILRRLVTGEPLPRLRDRIRADAALDLLVGTALAWDPEQRFADGVVLAEALDEYRATLPVAQRTLSLRTMMHEAFSNEIEQLPEFQRVTQVTPSQRSSGSLPNQLPAPVRRSRTVWVAAAAAALVAVVGMGIAARTSDEAPAPPPAVEAPAEPPRAAPPAAAEATRPSPSAEPPSPPVVERPAPPPPPLVKPDQPPAATPDPKSSRPAAGGSVAARKGKLSLETEPWTRVFLGKRLLGETPLLEVPLPAGRQRLRLVNPDEGIDAVVEVDVVPDTVVVKRLAL